jgi:hypothetical protein
LTRESLQIDVVQVLQDVLQLVRDVFDEARGLAYTDFDHAAPVARVLLEPHSCMVLRDLTHKIHVDDEVLAFAKSRALAAERRRLLQHREYECPKRAACDEIGRDERFGRH